MTRDAKVIVINGSDDGKLFFDVLTVVSMVTLESNKDIVYITIDSKRLDWFLLLITHLFCQISTILIGKEYL